MALELLTNNASTTLNGAVDGATDPVTFAVASATAFPASGNFRVIIDSEILKVTAVSGSDFTASRAQEGTSIASHLDTTAVKHVVTAASLKQQVGEFHLADAIGSRPAAGQYGRLFFPTTAGVIQRDTGSAYELWVQGKGPFTPPVADFTTWVNQGVATVATTNGYLFLSLAGVEAAANDLKMRVKSLPSTTFTMTLAFELSQGPGQTGIFGIALRNSGDSKILTHTFHPSSAVFANYYFSGSSNAFVGQDFADAFTREVGGLVFLRVRGDGTTYFFDNSVNGVDWINNRQVTIATSYVPAPDQIGFYLAIANARSNQTTGMSVYHALLT